MVGATTTHARLGWRGDASDAVRADAHVAVVTPRKQYYELVDASATLRSPRMRQEGGPASKQAGAHRQVQRMHASARSLHFLVPHARPR